MTKTNESFTHATSEIIAEVDLFSARNYHPLPVVLARGEGVWVWDVEGKKYLDCLGAYSAMSHGHCHPKLLKALQDQAAKITLTSRAFHNEQMGPFLRELCALSKMEVALPMNSGVEAVETAIKVARKWGYEKKGVPADRAEIVVCRNNFHGRTISVISFSSEEQYRRGFGPFTPGFRQIDFGAADQLDSVITPNTVAFLVEPIQAEAGILVPPDDYLRKAQEICRNRDVLLILDEIQTGLGRTGKLFCFEHHTGVVPDLLCLGKALGGGIYPVSAVLGSNDIFDVLTPGDHGSTFGGNPLAAAIGRSALDVLVSERLPERAAESGAYFMEKLRALHSPHIADLRGKGLLIGVEVKKASGPARPYCEKLLGLGLLAKETHGQVIRIAPPLMIERTEIDWAVEQLGRVLL